MHEVLPDQARQPDSLSLLRKIHLPKEPSKEAAPVKLAEISGHPVVKSGIP